MDITVTDLRPWLTSPRPPSSSPKPPTTEPTKSGTPRRLFVPSSREITFVEQPDLSSRPLSKSGKREGLVGTGSTSNLQKLIGGAQFRLGGAPSEDCIACKQLASEVRALKIAVFDAKKSEALMRKQHSEMVISSSSNTSHLVFCIHLPFCC